MGFFVLSFLLPLSPEASVLVPLMQAAAFLWKGNMCQLSKLSSSGTAACAPESPALLLKIRKQFAYGTFVL